MFLFALWMHLWQLTVLWPCLQTNRTTAGVSSFSRSRSFSRTSLVSGQWCSLARSIMFQCVSNMLKPYTPYESSWCSFSTIFRGAENRGQRASHWQIWQVQSKDILWNPDLQWSPASAGPGCPEGRGILLRLETKTYFTTLACNAQWHTQHTQQTSGCPFSEADVLWGRESARNVQCWVLQTSYLLRIILLLNLFSGHWGDEAAPKLRSLRLELLGAIWVISVPRGCCCCCC